MIEVTITLDVHGRGVLLKSLGAIEIINDGTGSSSRGNYVVRQLAKGNGRVVRVGQIKGWARNSRTPVQLLAAALGALGYDASGKKLSLKKTVPRKDLGDGRGPHPDGSRGAPSP